MNDRYKPELIIENDAPTTMETNYYVVMCNIEEKNIELDAISSALGSLEGVENADAELTSAIAELTARKDQLESEIETLKTQVADIISGTPSKRYEEMKKEAQKLVKRKIKKLNINSTEGYANGNIDLSKLGKLNELGEIIAKYLSLFSNDKLNYGKSSLGKTNIATISKQENLETYDSFLSQTENEQEIPEQSEVSQNSDKKGGATLGDMALEEVLRSPIPEGQVSGQSKRLSNENLLSENFENMKGNYKP